MPATEAAHLLRFAFFLLAAVALPGAALAPLFTSENGAERRDGLATALLSGLLLYFFVIGALRIAGAPYPACAAAMLAIGAALCLTAWSRPAARAEALSSLRAVFSPGTLLFLAFSCLLGWWFTYAELGYYHSDEALRLAFARAAGAGLPAQNPMIHSGTLNYYYAAEFFAGSASALSGVPLEVLYLRFMPVLNWTLLFFGMRALARMYSAAAPVWAPYAAFLCFLLLPPHLLPHFAYRQHGFALGLFSLGMAAGFRGLSGGGKFPLLLCALSCALITAVKLPFGALYLVFISCLLAAAVLRGLLAGRSAAAALLLSWAGFFGLYQLLSSYGVASGSMLVFGIREEWFGGFLPLNLTAPRLLAWARDSFGGPGPGLLTALENLLTLAVSCALPCLALWLAGRRLRSENPANSAGICLLEAAGLTMAAGGFLYLFVHFSVANGSDTYWLMFSVWALAAAAFPAFFSVQENVPSARIAALLLVPAAADLALSALEKIIPLSVPAVPVAALVAAAAAWSGLVAAWARRGGSRLAGAAMYTGLLLMALYHLYALRAEKDLQVFSAWLGAAAALPLLSDLTPSRGLLRGWRLLAVFPLMTALAHLPKSLYWAERTKMYNSSGWSTEQGQACAALNASPGGAGLYMHNLINLDNARLAAACRGRMFLSYSTLNGIWEEAGLYGAARRDVEAFFAGPAPADCENMLRRGVDRVYWDARGIEPGWPERAARQPWLRPLYRGRATALYAIADCASNGDANK